MGMFDTVHVPCPDCGKTSEVQTKSGRCCLGDYELNDPRAEEAMVGVLRENPIYCQHCGTRFTVEPAPAVRYWTRKVL